MATFKTSGVSFEEPQWRDLVSTAPSLMAAEHQGRLAANIKSLMQYMSEAELRSLAIRAPQVLVEVESLGAWFDFLEQYGFTSDQVAHLVSQVGSGRVAVRCHQLSMAFAHGAIPCAMQFEDPSCFCPHLQSKGGQRLRLSLGGL
jgi:hypothetical protein